MSCVLTLALDEASQARFEAERQRYFPPERNHIPAHVTLFHTLPESDAIASLLGSLAAQQSSFAIRVDHVRSIGRGVAYFLQAQQAGSLHRRLSEAFADDLSPQDRQGFRPHVVIQNKVTPETARETLAILQASFASWTAHATGLDFWRYLGGPWQHLQRFTFNPPAGDFTDR